MTVVPRNLPHASRRCLGLVLAVALGGCSAGMLVTQPDGPRGYLRLEVEPASAEVSIDEKYSGIANGWVANTIPVTPGMRRVTLSADGYITQRFDIEVAPYEEVTLVLNLEPELLLPQDESPRNAEPRRTRRAGR